MWPCISGLSWLGVLRICSLPPEETSHDQPLPKRFRPYSLILALKPAKSPNVDLMASASGPDGSPPPLGPMISQNIEWLAWPPPLLMTFWRIDSGTLLMSRISWSIDLDCRAVWPSRAALRLST